MIIGLCGEQGAGKDLVASFMHGYEKIAFADALRNMVCDSGAVVEYEGEQVHVSSVVSTFGWDGAKRQIPEIRRVLQNVGGAVRAIDPDYWVKEVARQAKRHPYVVCPDVRYQNEADLCNVVLLVHRPNNPFVQETRHQSESGWRGIATRATVVNDSTPPALHDRVKALLRKHGIQAKTVIRPQL